MKGHNTAGMLWLIAAVFSAAATLVFRPTDSVWYGITLAGSGVAAAVAVLLWIRPTSSTVGLSTLVGVAWAVMYVILVFDQIEDVQAWTANAFFALLGVAAALIAYRTTRTTSY